MMTSLTSSLPIDLNVLRAPAPPKREGSASFADDLSAASEPPVAADAPSPSPSPSPSCDHPDTTTPTQRRAQQRDDHRDERGDEPPEDRRDVPGAERRGARLDERDNDRDEPRNTRRAARRDERRAAPERARPARPKATPAADDGIERTTPHERAAKARVDAHADKAQAEPVSPEPAPVPAAADTPSTADFAARIEAVPPADARHTHALDALRQHVAAAQGGIADAPHGDAADPPRGNVGVDAARAPIAEGAANRSTRPQDARASRDARDARTSRDTRDQALVDGLPAPQAAGAVDGAAAFDATAVTAARSDIAASTPDAARPVGRSGAQGRAQMRGDADESSVSASRRVEADASLAAGDSARAIPERSAQADVSASTWREVFSMPAQQASAVGAAYATAGSAAAQASSVGTSEHTIAAAPGSAEFTRALSSQVTLWARDGTQEARLQLNPADLGPVTVLIAIDGAQARVDFHAHAAATREAIEASLPSLVGALGEQGLELSGGGVFDRSGREPSAPQQQATRTSASGRDALHDADDADDAARGLWVGARTTAPRGLVDLIA